MVLGPALPLARFDAALERGHRKVLDDGSAPACSSTTC
jgi:hypothetical protein